MRARPLLLTVLSALLSTPAHADGVDAYVENQLKLLHIPGASIAIVRGGRVLKARGYGLANVELGVPATTKTVYEIGSASKQFTALAVMLLVEEGKIALEDSVQKYFPNAPRSWSRITVRHLLTHTSGIQNHVAVPGYLRAFKTDLFFETTPAGDELVKKFFELPLEFDPGATWAYDNTGYILLGFVIERASGRPYWEFMRERIFEPLGMTSTRSTDPKPIVRGRASGYEWVGSSFENRPLLQPGIAFSAGAFLSTIEDLAKWNAGMERLVKPSTLEQMWSAARTNDGSAAPFDYGFGWFLGSYHGHRVVQHAGGTPGFSSTNYRFPDDGLSVIVLCNHSDKLIDPIALELAARYSPALRRTVAKTDPDPERSTKLQADLRALLAGKQDPTHFTAPMRTFFSTATGKSFWQWIGSIGELRSFDFSEEEPIAGGRLLRYRAIIGESTLWLTIDVRNDGTIARVWWW